ncbi:hypothetical protein H4R21_001637 [Coemansia helicoidea]|uniref:Uncharacterized protein n=1 Tax=Coemansia helicoidea TaxID=1286919 RepID=A0ACC1LBM2_9FUNG|nr:hypothetical protein H4R21_001637 [Coemansia helicoidea]
MNSCPHKAPDRRGGLKKWLSAKVISHAQDGGQQSMHVAPRLQRKPAAARSNRHSSASFSPPSVLAPAPTPLPSTDSVDAAAPKDLDAGTQPANRKSKRGLPLRKRSLIYAIYCTAQPGANVAPGARSPVTQARAASPETAGFAWQSLQKYQIEPPASHPLAAINVSSIYGSCQSRRSSSVSIDSASSGSEASSIVSISPGGRSHGQHMSDMSIRFMVVDVVNHLTALQHQACGANGRSSCTSVASSRSSCTEQQVVGETAYRCSSRYAPRLSTVERVDDGRLLLRPSGSTVLTQDTCTPAGSDESAAGGMGAAGGHLPAPHAPLANGAVDSMRIHVSKLGVEAQGLPACAFEYDASLASLDGPAVAAVDPDGAGSLTSLPDAHRFYIITPPESPNKSNQTTANTSLATAVPAGDDLDASSSGAAGAGMGGPAKAAELPSKLVRCYYTSEDGEDDSPGSAKSPVEPRDSVMASTEAGRHGAECSIVCSPSPPAPPAASAQVSCVSGVEPAASDATGTRQPALEGQHQMSATGTETSLLFGGHYASIVRTAVADCHSPVPLHSGAQTAADAAVPPSTVAALPDGAGGMASQPRAQEASRPRKLTAALVKAAQLDGLRHLQRMIRSGGGRRAHSGASTASRAASSSSSSSSVGSGTGSKSAYGTQRSRPTGTAQRQKVFRFNELVAVYETWDRGEYDRRGMPATKLDAELIEQIKQELNDFKAHEMPVHDESRANTHFIL